MSRIGNKAITIPAGVEVTVAAGNEVTVKGPKGTLTRKFNENLGIVIDGNVLTVTRPNEEKHTKQLHGTTRALINNMVVGVSEGYKAELEIVGVGYRVSNQGNVITFELLHSHSIVLVLPSEIEVETKSERNKNPLITLESCDKQLLGQVCAKIRSFRKPEPYKGKGIKFVGEVIRRKSGKSAAAK